MDSTDLQAGSFQVSGRTFVPSQHTTFEQDLFIMDHVRNCGIENVVIDSVNLSAAAEEIVLKAYRAGQLFQIMAGIVEEKGKPWSVEEAQKNAVFFSQLRDPEDKKAVQGTVVALILSFFVNEEGSFVISPKSSGENPRLDGEGEESIEVPEV